MKGLAAWIMRGPAQATGLAASALLLGIAVPPFLWVGSAVIALVILSTGAAGAARVTAGALAAASVAGWLITGSPYLIGLMGLASWLPVMVVAGVLRTTARLDFALLAATVMGWAIVIGLHAAIGDPSAAWRDWLEMMVASDAVTSDLELDGRHFEDVVERLAPMMTGLLAASTVLSSVTATFLGRCGQAALYNPGGFRREFHRLRLGRTAALVTAILMALGVWAGTSFAFGLAAVAGTVFLLQGLAVVHGLVAARGMHVGWLVGVYVLGAVLFVQMALALIILGIADGWLDLRGRGRRPEA